jgi:hypothetical protein
MRGYVVLLHKEITEQWRTGRLPVVALTRPRAAAMVMTILARACRPSAA